jgi:hypothetical protein
MGVVRAMCIWVVLPVVTVGCGSTEDNQKAACKVGGAALGVAVAKISRSDDTGALTAMFAEAGCNAEVRQLNADPQAVVSFTVLPVSTGAAPAPVSVSLDSLRAELTEAPPDSAVQNFEEMTRCYQEHPTSALSYDWCRQGLIP